MDRLHAEGLPGGRLYIGRLKKLLIDNQHALVCLVDQGVVSVAGFATSVLIGRHAPEELGVFYIALSIVLFVRGFQQQMISTPYTIYQHQHSGNGLAAYRGSSLLQLAGLVAVTLAIISGLMVGANWSWVSPEMLAPLGVLFLFMPILLLREVVRQFCFTHMKNVTALAIDSAITTLQIVAILALGYWGALSGTIAWAAIGGACLTVLVFWYLKHRPEIQFQRARVLEDWKQNWSFGKWAVAGQLVGSLPSYLLPWVLAAAAGTEGTGFFAAAMTLIGIANIFNTGLANFLTPKAAEIYVEHGVSGLRRFLLRMAAVFLVAMGSFALVLGVAGGWLAIQLYGDKYTGLQTAMTLLAIAKLFESFSILSSSGLFVMEKIKANFYADVVLMVVTLTSVVLLVYPYGVMGAVWTTLINSLVSAALRSGLLTMFLSRKSEEASDE